MKLTVHFQQPHLCVGTGIPVAREFVERDPYEGEYTVTPSAETQVLQTNNLRMTGDVTVNPIPSDWGHITWNGSYITIT